MAPPFVVAAVSRQDSSSADGIHLLWTAPQAAGYSVNGYDIQRRIAGRQPEIECHTFTADELQALHRDFRLDIGLAGVKVRRTECPTFPRTPPDEPQPEEPPPRPRQCVEFKAIQPGPGPNPRTEQGVTFRVPGPSGAPAGQTLVRKTGAFVGLDCGFTLEIRLASPSSFVELTLVHFSQPAKVEAFRQDGSSAGVKTMSAAGGHAETILFTAAAAIVRAVVTAPRNEALLLSVCFEPPKCIDLQSFAPGSGPNPRIEQGHTFHALGPNGAPVNQTAVKKMGQFTGLDCAFTLEIGLRAPAQSVEITLVRFAQPAKLEAFRADGSSAGTQTMTAPQGQAETLRFSGAGIARIIVATPNDEILLLRLCVDTPWCVDFTKFPTGTGSNPRIEQGIAFHVQEPPSSVTRQTVIRQTGAFTGLDCQIHLDIRLPAPTPSIELTLVHFAQGVKVQAINSDGSIAGATVLTGASGQPETVRLSGAAINAVTVSAPADETLLLSFCIGSAPAGDDRGGQASRFVLPSISEFAHAAGTAAAAATGRFCLVYTLDLRGAHQFARVAAGVPVVLMIALRDGKAVETRVLAGAPGPQDYTFRNRSVDSVLLYVGQPLDSLTICVDILNSDAEEDKEWAGASYIAKGVQLPVRAVNPALASAADEQTLASSRLLSGEAFDAAAFRMLADTMDDTAAGNAVASPMCYTTMTRERVDDPFIELRAWPYSLAVLADAPWRRMLGFAFLDKGGGLAPGTAYDYRITGWFRRRDIEEQFFGFHTVPSGTLLPDSFHLGSLLLNGFGASRVEMYPAVSGSALRGTGRKGVHLRPGLPASLAITFPIPVTAVVLEFEVSAPHSLNYAARTTDYLVGLSGSVFSGAVPRQSRVQIDFAEPIDTLALQGSAFFYGVRVVGSPPGTSPDEVVPRTAVLPAVRYEATLPPVPPPFLGTTNLQEPVVAGDPAITTQNPPQLLGFELHWLPAPAGGSGPVPWPADLGAFPPFDALGFQIERRRVDTGDPFAEIEPHTLFFGSRSGRRTPPQLTPGIDLLLVYPESVRPQPPVPVFMEQEDVLVGAATPGPPPGSLHQYRIFAVDAIGRRSAVPTVGSVVRLEKHVPPPQPASPTTAPPAGSTLPSGVRARVLQASDPDLPAADRTLLGASANAIVLEWGWTLKERERDPYANTFRLYFQPVPPDAVHGTLTGAAALVGGFYEMAANLDQPVSADAMASRYLRAGDYPFKVSSHTGGTAITVRFEPALIHPERVPGPGSFEFHPVMNGSELRPSGWPERTAVVPITVAEDYQFVFRDRLTLDATHTAARVWVGVSAADDQSYIADEIPAAHPNGGRPGNESSIAVAVAGARYLGQPVFTVPPPLPDVPEFITQEPGAGAVPAPLNLPLLLPAVAIPAGHKVTLERLGMDVLVSLVSARLDNQIGAAFPDGTSATYTLASPADQAALLAAIRSRTPARVEGRFLMDFLLRYPAQLEKLWELALPAPVAFGTITDTLPDKAERYVHRVRLADPAGHISSGAAIVPQIVRVPSLRSPAPPDFDAANSETGSLTVTARVHDAFDLKWVLLFTLVRDAGSPAEASALDKPQLLRLPNRRDLYPADGIRLRLRDGTLLAPAATDVSTGTVEVPDRVLTITLAPGFEKQVSVWAVAMTRDGVPSRLAGPRAAVTGPRPLVTPALTVAAAAHEDHASWAALAVPAEVAIERTLDAGANWSRVSPWLPETAARAFTVPHSGGARQYRLVLRGSRDRRTTGPAVTPT